MTDERWQLAHAIYEAAAPLAESERKQYVHATAPDAEIAGRVLAMLDEMETTADSDAFPEACVFNRARRRSARQTTCRMALRSAVLSSPVLSARGEWAESIPLTTPI